MPLKEGEVRTASQVRPQSHRPRPLPGADWPRVGHQAECRPQAFPEAKVSDFPVVASTAIQRVLFRGAYLRTALSSKESCFLRTDSSLR